MAKKASKKPSKPKAAVTKKTSPSRQRRVKPSTYRSFRPSKRIKPEAGKNIKGSIRLFFASLKILRQNWRLFLTITLVYGFLSIILVRGFGGSLNLSNIKASLKDGLQGQYSQLATGAILFSYLLGSSGSSASQTGGVYQTLLVILLSLVVIWALRQVMAGHVIKARDAFYKGTYPLVQFILVLLVIGLQLVPLLIGSWLYTTVSTNGIAVTGLEKFIWLLLLILLIVLSLYMICSSLFALYVVTLPDMTPLKALRSARALVKYRRWTVLRKILFLPLAILIAGAIIMIPLILLLTPIAEWAFFALSMLVLVVVHSYMYSLYRELL